MENVYEVIQKYWDLDEANERSGEPVITTFICEDKEAAKAVVGNIRSALCAETDEDGVKQDYSFECGDEGLTCNARDTTLGREYEISASEMPVITGKANGKPKEDGRKWFEVSVMETFKRTFRVLANDKEDAENIINDAMNDGVANCDEGKGASYERETTEVREVGENEYVHTYEGEGYFDAR